MITHNVQLIKKVIKKVVINANFRTSQLRAKKRWLKNVGLDYQAKQHTHTHVHKWQKKKHS